MNTQSSFSEILMAEPLALRLHWRKCNSELHGISLQRIDLLWAKALEQEVRQEEVRKEVGKGEGRKAEYQVATRLTIYGEQIQEGLARYVAGVPVDWRELCAAIPLFWQGIPPFRKRVLQTLYDNVGYGLTIRYGELAALAGSPKAARAVGSAMSANPWPLIIP